MFKSLLVALTIATAATPATSAQHVDIYTAYTPYGGRVIMASTDATTHDDDAIITMDDGAEIYISMECNNANYTLYAIDADGVHEIWMYGYGTPAWSDDIAADWQVWPYPSITQPNGCTK